MNTIIKTTVIFLMIMLTACSSDDSKKTEGPLSERLEYEYTAQPDIPNDGGVYSLIINMEVEEDRVVIDPSKVQIEISLEHESAIQISYGYLMPNTGDEFNTIVNGLGGYNAYLPQNVLSFNPENVQVIATTEYPDGDIPSGNYKEGTIDPNFPVETPLFKSMLNKNIKGEWKFYFLDDHSSIQGRLHKIKLIFDEGALEVTQN